MDESTSDESSDTGPEEKPSNIEASDTKSSVMSLTESGGEEAEA